MQERPYMDSSSVARTLSDDVLGTTANVYPASEVRRSTRSANFTPLNGWLGLRLQPFRLRSSPWAAERLEAAKSGRLQRKENPAEAGLIIDPQFNSCRAEPKAGSVFIMQPLFLINAVESSRKRRK